MKTRLFILILFNCIGLSLIAQLVNVKIPDNQLSKHFKKGYVLEQINAPKNLIMNSEGAFFHVNNPIDLSINHFLYIGRVNTCRAGGCSTTNNLSAGNSEYFDYFIIYNQYFIIQSVSIYNYQASHGYELTSSFWLKQFKGYDGSKELIYGEDIDAVAGATISGNAAIADIEYKTKLLKQISNKLN
jgi:hypothetical protein